MSQRDGLGLFLLGAFFFLAGLILFFGTLALFWVLFIGPDQLIMDSHCRTWTAPDRQVLATCISKPQPTSFMAGYHP